MVWFARGGLADGLGTVHSVTRGSSGCSTAPIGGNCSRDHNPPTRHVINTCVERTHRLPEKKDGSVLHFPVPVLCASQEVTVQSKQSNLLWRTAETVSSLGEQQEPTQLQRSSTPQLQLVCYLSGSSAAVPEHHQLTPPAHTPTDGQHPGGQPTLERKLAAKVGLQSVASCGHTTL